MFIVHVLYVARSTSKNKRIINLVLYQRLSLVMGYEILQVVILLGIH